VSWRLGRSERKGASVDFDPMAFEPVIAFNLKLMEMIYAPDFSA
jgi:hypothetical protein